MTFMTREVIPMLTLWKSLVQCKLDYCSQLWSPARKGDIHTIEMVQNSFLRKLPAIRHMSYWQKLKQLKLYSQERRRERYTIIYIWRMLEGKVPCINSLDGGAKVKSIWHIRRGRECQIPCINHHSPRNIQALKHATLPVRGQQLFNTLPRDIRNMTGCKVDMFKRRLDKYLSTIPDEPQVLGRGLCRMKMLPVMILANYHSSARSAVSERPNSSARLVSQCPNSSAWLVSQCPNSSARLVFPMFQVELRLAFECSNSNTNDRQFEVCAFGWVFFTISITFCYSMTFMSMY